MLRWHFVGLVLGLCLASCLHAQKQPANRPSSPKPAEQPAKPDYPLDSLTAFSATMVGGPTGNVDELKIYRSGNLMRTEMLDGNYMVTDLATYSTFVVLSNRCVQDSRPSVNTFPFSAVRPGYRVERKSAGTETLEGHACQLEDVIITPEHGLPLTLKLWEAMDLSGFPIKVEIHRMTGSTVTMTYKDIKIAPPDPTLFRHPANCAPSSHPATLGAPKVPAKPSKPAPKPPQN
jgi:hypothetical protein